LLLDGDAVENGAVLVNKALLGFDASIVAHQVIAHRRGGGSVAHPAQGNADMLLRLDAAEAGDELTERGYAYWISHLTFLRLNHP
jgi:hypothetical protein